MQPGSECGVDFRFFHARVDPGAPYILYRLAWAAIRKVAPKTCTKKNLGRIPGGFEVYFLRVKLVNLR